jgi:two-component system response regulator FlrC
MARSTIMVVAGDSTLLTAVTQVTQLNVPHARVHEFQSPRLALAQLEHQDVTLVTDLNMEEPDGFALLRGVKALRPNVPVIMFSSHVDPALALQAVSVGAQEVLRKPFHATEFLMALTLALNLYDVAREVQIRRLMVNAWAARVTVLDG